MLGTRPERLIPCLLTSGTHDTQASWPSRRQNSRPSGPPARGSNELGLPSGAQTGVYPLARECLSRLSDRPIICSQQYS